MTTAGSILGALDVDSHVLLEGISWEQYEQILDELQGRRVKVTYDRGRLEIMAPIGSSHESWKKSIARLIELMAFERGIDVAPLGATTYKRKDLAKGLEPDECYYVIRPDAIRGKKRLKLPDDPPPDLAIEVDDTSWSIPRLPIYAALGVPEVWRFDGSRLHVLRLSSAGSYDPAKRSGLFPFLKMTPFAQYVLRLGQESSIAVLKEFRDWVRSL